MGRFRAELQPSLGGSRRPAGVPTHSSPAGPLASGGGGWWDDPGSCWAAHGDSAESPPIGPVALFQGGSPLDLVRLKTQTGVILHNFVKLLKTVNCAHERVDSVPRDKPQ